MTAPVFFDPTGRRSFWARHLLAAALLLAIAAAAAFATTLVAVPRGRDLQLPFPQPHAEKLRAPRLHARGLAAWLPGAHAADPRTPLTIGFFVPGDDAGIASLRRHVHSLDWVAPAAVTLGGPDHELAIHSDPRLDRMLAAMRHPPKLMPMVQNLWRDEWDGAGTVRLMADRHARAVAIARLAALVERTRAAGLIMDLEDLPDASLPAYLGFLRELRARLPIGSVVAVTAPAGDDAWRLDRFARAADRVILMAYDEHWQTGAPGPIASQPWFVRQVERALRQVGRDRLVVALGSYAYDWHGGEADALSVEEAWLAAHDSAAPIEFDRASGNAGFAYEEGGARHQVWMLDAAASWNELQALKRLGVDDVALWKMRSEDPGLWPSLTAFRNGGLPDLRRLDSPLNTDVEGTGELLRVTATPSSGARALRLDAQGVVRDERYAALPTPYVVQRAGAAPKEVALTFDDGPDAAWTPRILDVLERERAPATFFVIGENALSHPGLLNRIIRDGGEIGNHSYTHPNLALATPAEVRLELNATQRLVEAYTGRATRLFRAPYFGDAEPTTADELGPALEAQRLGYTVVGLHVDPNDWQRPGADAIVREVVDQVHRAGPGNSANIVLLHDGGGDRAQTVAALPRIIDALRADGYRFVPASRLAGLSPADAMPAVTGDDLLAVRTDVAMFVAAAAIVALVAWLFYLAIALGMARAVMMAGLAWLQSRRERAAPPSWRPSVTVIIPAFNEEEVIEASIARVLASDYPDLRLIVVDDGSRDRTSAVVEAAFGGDPRVELLTLSNGGKARALNRALARAGGEVVIALDADTQFERETVARLARWFADPAVGAVAGDARVGNRVNLVTRWQAVEYVTAQNLERRALAGFDAITVVPGAVGAWRRAALDAVGGYPEDTLAEDQDLTIAVQRAGWRVLYDPRAVAWTEAPETFRALAKQRYRWAFGTLQCLWKHRAVLRTRRPLGLATIGLPQAWLFQIFFAALSPLIDLALLVSAAATLLRVRQHGWAQTSGDVGRMALYWLAFTAVDVACGWVAYRLDGRGDRYPAPLLVAQRIVYRQIMYSVVLRALISAVGGRIVGWGKLERTGSVAAAQG